MAAKLVTVYSARGSDYTAYTSALLTERLSGKGDVLLVPGIYDGKPEPLPESLVPFRSESFFDQIGFRPTDRISILDYSKARELAYKITHAAETSIEEARKMIVDAGLHRDYIVWDIARSYAEVAPVLKFSSKIILVCHDYALAYLHTGEVVRNLSDKKDRMCIVVPQSLDEEKVRTKMNQEPFTGLEFRTIPIEVDHELALLEPKKHLQHKTLIELTEKLAEFVDR